MLWKSTNKESLLMQVAYSGVRVAMEAALGQFREELIAESDAYSCWNYICI